MKSILAIIVLSIGILLVACSKDKFETKPKLEIKDYNSKEIHQGEVMRIRLNYFDKEGDLNKAPFLAIIRRLNRVPLPPGQDKVDTLRSTMPEFPAKDNGEITFQLPFDFLKESLIQNDTIQFRFAVIDLAGNSSDTLTTDPIVIVLP